jgi:hypothetical protein
MSATSALTADLRKQVLVLEDDLRARVEADPSTRGAWMVEHNRAVDRGRTAASWVAWRDDRVTQAAVAWVLSTVFVRFCEDNALVDPVWIAGPAPRRQEALDGQLAFFRSNPEETDREWLLESINHLGSLPATAALVEEHSPLWVVAPSGDAASALLAFWRRRGDDGELVHDLTDPELDTRFLGDLYQDLSEHAKSTYALLQTPVFVEEFILDRTLEPALKERPLAGFRMIDPTCGSGHFLLGAFSRLLDRWHREAPGMEIQARVQTALDAVHGVDLNPFAVAIARFRLIVAALQACGLRSLEAAPAFTLYLAVGDSLLHGPGQLTLNSDTDLASFVYATEDLTLLQEILAGGRYDVVVGNPPYITVKDKVLNAAYRERYDACKGTYALTVPFMERFFGLAKPGREGQPAGWAGQITGNSFMKREFGSKIVEDFLAHRDLRLIADTSGAYIPGHGTPTVIIVGRNQRASDSSVRAALGVRGEPGQPEDPARGVVWRSLVEHIDEPGWDDGWVTIADLDRVSLSTHPWSLSGGGAVGLLGRVNESAGGKLRGVLDSAGFMTVTREDDAYLIGAATIARLGIGKEFAAPLCGGSEVRDWEVRPESAALVPYDATGRPSADEAALRHLWRYKQHLLMRRALSGTQLEQGLEWFEYSQLNRQRFLAELLLSFAFVATHNHFVMSRGDQLFSRSAPVVRLPAGASEDEYLRLLGLLNSSTACFWLKQNSQSKAGSGIGRGVQDEEWESRYEFTGTTLQDYPLPTTLPVGRGRLLDSLAQELARFTPGAVAAGQIPNAEVLKMAHAESERLRARMIAVQEELDWECYRLYGLIEEDMTYPAADLPGLALGERSFEVVLARAVAGGEDTAWFTRHGSQSITDLPSYWPTAYRELVQRRLDLIASDPNIRLLERPEYKRRWASEPWEKQQTAALRNWLLDRLEDRRYWFDRAGRPAPCTVAQLADAVSRDADFVSVLALWEGRPDTPVSASLVKLLADEAVPFLAAHRYKDTGLRAREAWEATWALQRREDAGEKVGTIPVPPKYTSADFRKTSYWQARGKLDVPKERFIAYPDAGRETDPTPLLGWAGWDHAQQSLALSVIIAAREADGWSDERLVPLVAGLAELQPWVEQWHADLDPAYGVSLAAFCREQLTARAAQVAKTTAELAAWRPEPATRGRRARST